MITYKQFLILLFLEGSDAANTTDQSLLESCPSWVPRHRGLSGPVFLAKPPSAHAFNDGSLKVLSHFSHYLLFLRGDFIHTMIPIITNMLMTPNPLCSNQITLPSSRPTDPIASSDICT